MSTESKSSPKKLVANRANAKKSTGPKTAAGKEKSSQNSWKHGYFTRRLFKTPEQETEDMPVYMAIRNGLFDRYRPFGLVEEFWTDRVAAEMLRSLRLVGHEQESFHTLQFIATAIPIDTILRVQAVNTRQLQFAIDQLEKLQELRKSSPTDGAREDFDELQDLEPQETEAEDSILPASEVCEGENCETNPNLTGEDEPIEPE